MSRLKRAGVIKGLEPWGAIPLRLSRDPTLTALHLRVVNEIAYHDRMSDVTKTGQGCWVSYVKIARAIGANNTNVSTAINQLVDKGYLKQEEIANDRRRRVYRLIYQKADAGEWKSAQPSSSHGCFASGQNNPEPDSLPRHRENVCPRSQSSNTNRTETLPQYIPLSGERYFAKQKIFRETIKTNSPEGAHSAARPQRRGVLDIETAGNLARFSRMLGDLSANEIAEWREFLELEAEDSTDGLRTTSGWASRLLELIDPNLGVIAS